MTPERWYVVYNGGVVYKRWLRFVEMCSFSFQCSLERVPEHASHNTQAESGGSYYRNSSSEAELLANIEFECDRHLRVEVLCYY